MTSTALALVNNLGVLSLGAVALFLTAVRLDSAEIRGWRSLFVGMMLGALSFVVVKMPIPSPLGATFDTRAAPLVLAGYLGGGPAGLAAATIAAIARYSVGGPAALGGMVSVFCYAATGWAAAVAAARSGRRRMGVGGWLAIAAAATVAALPSFFVGQPVEVGLAVLEAYWPLLTAGNLLGVVMLGMIVEELRRFIAERDRHREQLHLSDLARKVAGVGQWRYSLTEDRLEWDDAQLEIMGVDRQDFGGDFAAFRDRVHPDDWPDLARRFEEARRTLGSYDARIRIYTPAGDLRYLRVSATCVGGEPGAPHSIVGLNMDETRDVSLLAELELKGAALDSALNGIVIASADASQPVVYVNRAFTEITGYHAAEVIGRNCRFLNRGLAEEDHRANAEALRQIRQAIGSGGSCEVVVRNRRKNGETFWNALRLSAIRNGVGVVTHFIGVQDDVTQEVEQRQAVSEARDQMQAILTAAPDAMVTIDAAFRVTSFNAAAERLFGWRSEEIMGKSATLLAPERDDLDHLSLMRGYMSGPTKSPGPMAMNRVVEARRKDGSTFPAHVALARFMDRGAPAVSVMAHDMSDTVATRRELEKLSDDLAKQLKAAEAANEAKSQFLSVISHELRTPLNGVLGMAQLLTTTTLDEKQALFADTILDSGAALQRIIEDILDLTMMASGRITMDFATHEVRAILERSVARVGAARDVGARIEISLDPDIEGASIVTDRDRLEQVIANLLDNALKFGERKPVRLSVAPLDDQRCLRLEVRDQGVGIPRDKHEIIFHRFTQADQSATRGFGGAGLGLSICREIVTALGGRISVISEEGEGATFRVDLPRDPQAGGAVAPIAGVGGSRAGADGGGHVIVVVDDDPTSASIVTELARSLGLRSFTYHHPEAALRARMAWGPALVFTDLHMPGMSGAEFVTALRASDAPLAGVVMMTADAHLSKADFVRMGADMGIHKPIDLNAVRRIMAYPSASISSPTLAASA